MITALFCTQVLGLQIALFQRWLLAHSVSHRPSACRWPLVSRRAESLTRCACRCRTKPCPCLCQQGKARTCPSRSLDFERRSTVGSWRQAVRSWTGCLGAKFWQVGHHNVLMMHLYLRGLRTHPQCPRAISGWSHSLAAHDHQESLQQPPWPLHLSRWRSWGQRVSSLLSLLPQQP